MAPGDQRPAAPAAHRQAAPAVAPKRRRREGGLKIAVVDERGRPFAARSLRRWLTRVAPAKARGVVTIALASDRRVHALNKTYRKKNYATDVLSFPQDEDGMLGDVVIATGVAKRQARAAGHPVDTEMKVLALHGLLHLLGYDHEKDDGRMARVERRLRRRGGLPESLTERVQRAETPKGRRRVHRADAAKGRPGTGRAEAAKRRRRSQ